MHQQKKIVENPQNICCWSPITCCGLFSSPVKLMCIGLRWERWRKHYSNFGRLCSFHAFCRICVGISQQQPPKKKIIENSSQHSQSSFALNEPNEATTRRKMRNFFVTRALYYFFICITIKFHSSPLKKRLERMKWKRVFTRMLNWPLENAVGSQPAY